MLLNLLAYPIADWLPPVAEVWSEGTCGQGGRK